jgi:hypothetical protein
MKAIDVASDTAGIAHKLADLGIQAVAFYLRADRASLDMVRGLATVGIKRISIWERGYPTCSAYFTLDQAEKDASAAIAFAAAVGQPKGTEIFFAVDYDASAFDVERTISPYFQRVQAIVKGAGYLSSSYASGLVCRTLLARGFAHSAWLAQSPGWQGYASLWHDASILQGPETTILGFDVDLDDVRNPLVAW